ncbi:MAG: AAA family ATPase [Gammaproteobacteria bacterium]|nr:AAA family ATPase [Gammaproteobacteria bacterium]
MFQSFYNFKKNPFLLTADPSFFFESSTHKKAISYLLYGITQEEGFIAIIGDVGTGKTTIITHLLEQVKNKDIVIANIVTTNVRSTDILRLICAELGLAYKERTKAFLLRNLEKNLIKCAHEGKRVLLIIDEAQNLPVESIEELRMISNFQLEGRPLMQCYLLGQLQLRDILESDKLKQLRQRIIATHYIKPLDNRETEEYIKHRLIQASWKNDPELDPDVFTAIYEYSHGIPRIINLICGRLLLYGEIEELHRIDHQAFEQVLDDIKDELWTK